MEFNDIMLPSPPSAFALLRSPRIWRSLSRKGSKGQRSWIKRHRFFLVEIGTNNSPLSPYWACHLCDAKSQPEFFAAAATSSAADHLCKYMNVKLRACAPLTNSEWPKRRRLQYSAVPRTRVKMIRELSLGLLINTNVPFSFFSRLLDDIYGSKNNKIKQELLDAFTRIHIGFDL
ncbi:Protein transport protein SFT1 [Fusarium oxysporum f. sp. albedinis]|nr:Protein transport protein SFT1 [Fusarium oxysporum f. sp. albedinis]